MVIMLTLATLFPLGLRLPFSPGPLGRAASVICKNLYIAGNSYLVDHNYVLAQIPATSVSSPPYALLGVNTFVPISSVR